MKGGGATTILLMVIGLILLILGFSGKYHDIFAAAFPGLFSSSPGPISRVGPPGTQSPGMDPSGQPIPGSGGVPSTSLAYPYTGSVPITTSAGAPPANDPYLIGGSGYPNELQTLSGVPGTGYLTGRY